jgi:hypothetical protein
VDSNQPVYVLYSIKDSTILGHRSICSINSLILSPPHLTTLMDTLANDISTQGTLLNITENCAFGPLFLAWISVWWIQTLAWRIATLGRPFSIYKAMRFGQRTATDDVHYARDTGLPIFTTPSDFVSLATAEWNLALQHLSKEWKISCSGCALIAP